jgi:hypothetical protein
LPAPLYCKEIHHDRAAHANGSAHNNTAAA